MAEKKKILLVDDDKVFISMVKKFLENDYEIITASSGNEALSYYLKGQFPNLVLLDILMPVMDGWETYNRLKALSFLKDIPVAFLTSVDSDAHKDHALGIGAADFIAKPCEKNELLGRVKRILEIYEG